MKEKESEQVCPGLLGTGSVAHIWLEVPAPLLSLSLSLSLFTCNATARKEKLRTSRRLQGPLCLRAGTQATAAPKFKYENNQVKKEFEPVICIFL